VFPFIKFPGVDPILGPEMKSTGEAMGIGKSFGEAYGKSQLSAGVDLPKGGSALISVREADKPRVVELARKIHALGFEILATKGTHTLLTEHGVESRCVNKVKEGRPDIGDMIKNGEIDLIVNTTEGKKAIRDSSTIRRYALQYKVAYTTTITGAEALCEAMMISGIHEGDVEVYRIQDIHNDLSV